MTVFHIMFTYLDVYNIAIKYVARKTLEYWKYLKSCKELLFVGEMHIVYSLWLVCYGILQVDFISICWLQSYSSLNSERTESIHTVQRLCEDHPSCLIRPPMWRETVLCAGSEAAEVTAQSVFSAARRCWNSSFCDRYIRLTLC